MNSYNYEILCDKTFYDDYQECENDLFKQIFSLNKNIYDLKINNKEIIRDNKIPLWNNSRKEWWYNNINLDNSTITFSSSEESFEEDRYKLKYKNIVIYKI
jgi:hypothetical protein